MLTVISLKDIWLDTALIALLWFCQNFPKLFFLKATCQKKISYCLEMHHIYHTLAQFCPKIVLSLPMFVDMNIQGVTDHSCIEQPPVVVDQITG